MKKLLLVYLVLPISFLGASEPHQQEQQHQAEIKNAKAVKEVLEHQKSELETAYAEKERALKEQRAQEEALRNQEEVARLNSELAKLAADHVAVQTKFTGTFESLDSIVREEILDPADVTATLEAAMGLTSAAAIMLAEGFVEARTAGQEVQKAVQAISAYKPVREWVEKFWKENVSLTWAEIVGNRKRVEMLKTRILELERSLDTLKGQENFSALAENLGNGLSRLDDAFNVNNTAQAQEAAKGITTDVMLVSNEIDAAAQKPQNASTVVGIAANAAQALGLELKQVTYYEYLGVSPQASPDEIDLAIGLKWAVAPEDSLDRYHLRNARKYLIENKAAYDANPRTIGVFSKGALPELPTEPSLGDL